MPSDRQILQAQRSWAPRRGPRSARSSRTPKGIAVDVRSGGQVHPSPPAKRHFLLVSLVRRGELEQPPDAVSPFVPDVEAERPRATRTVRTCRPLRHGGALRTSRGRGARPRAGVTHRAGREPVRVARYRAIAREKAATALVLLAAFAGERLA